ncbi:MAG: hypothetical protein E7652_00895 [Ruminococcaceae bacterium]|nr:hypothetical protein [Oscillospiraceae bacterium]
MKRIISIFLTILCLTASLVSCKDNHGKSSLDTDALPENFLKETSPSNDKKEPLSSNNEKDMPKAETDYAIPYIEGLDYNYDLNKYITLPDYKSDSFKFDYTPTDNASIDLELERLSIGSRYAKLTEKSTGCENGDMVVFDYTSQYRDDNSNALSGKGISIRIGSEMFAPGFDSFIKGLSAGKSKTFSFTFPSDWTKSIAVAEETLEFNVTVLKVFSIVPADIDTVVEEHGAKSVDELREIIKDTIDKNNRYNFLQAIIAQSEVISYPQKEFEICKSLFDRDIEARAEINHTTVDGIIATDYSGDITKFEAERVTFAENKCKEDLVIFALQDIYPFELTVNEYNLILAEYHKENGSAMALSSIEEVHKNLGQALADSLFLDKAAELAYADR